MLWQSLLFTIVGLLLFGACHGDSSTFICPEYSAKKTDDAEKFFCNCAVLLCPSQFFYADGCDHHRGKQIIRLVDDSGLQYASSLDYQSTCGSGAEIQNFSPSISVCQIFHLRMGCSGNSACGGQIRIRVSNSSMDLPIANHNRFRDGSSVLDDGENEAELTEDSWSSKADPSLRGRKLTESFTGYGYCDYVRPISLGTIIGISMVPMLCCFICCMVGYRIYYMSPKHKVLPEIPLQDVPMVSASVLECDGNQQLDKEVKSKPSPEMLEFLDLSVNEIPTAFGYKYDRTRSTVRGSLALAYFPSMLASNDETRTSVTSSIGNSSSYDGFTELANGVVPFNHRYRSESETQEFHQATIQYQHSIADILYVTQMEDDFDDYVI